MSESDDRIHASVRRYAGGPQDGPMTPDKDALRRMRRNDEAWRSAPEGFDGIHNHPETQCQADIDRHDLLHALAAAEAAALAAAPSPALSRETTSASQNGMVLVDAALAPAEAAPPDEYPGVDNRFDGRYRDGHRAGWEQGRSATYHEGYALGFDRGHENALRAAIEDASWYTRHTGECPGTRDGDCVCGWAGVSIRLTAALAAAEAAPLDVERLRRTFHTEYEETYVLSGGCRHAGDNWDCRDRTTDFVDAHARAYAAETEP